MSKLIKQPSTRRWDRDSDIQKVGHGPEGTVLGLGSMRSQTVGRLNTLPCPNSHQ